MPARIFASPLSRKVIMPFFASHALDFGSRPPIHDHFADAVGQIQQFANGGAAMITRARTFQAAGALGKP